METRSDQVFKTIIIYVVILFCFGRALSLAVGDYSIAGMNIVQLYGIFFSYAFILLIIFNIRKIKFDFLSISILIFVFYCLLSIAWGTNDTKELIKIILPYTTLFLLRLISLEDSESKLILNSFALGYLIPIVGSAYLVYFGVSIQNVDYYSGVERSTGMWNKIHPFAHSMLFFSFLYALLISNKPSKKFYFNWILHAVFFLSAFCLFKSYTRTVYVGFMIFWSIFLLNLNKKIFGFFLFAALILFAVNNEYIKNIFMKKSDRSVEIENQLDHASSGRLTLWVHNLQYFSKAPIERKLLGYGIGAESDTVKGAKDDIWSSHNDYLSLLMTLGVVGLLLYWLIYLLLIIDIAQSNIFMKEKILYLSMVFAVISMSFISNGYLFRFEVSQSFWLLIGLFYIKAERYASKTKKSAISVSL